MTRSALCSFILLLAGTDALAQQFPVRNYSVKDGLLRNAVRSIHQDHGGWMWFATADGVERYDGAAFTHFTTEKGLAHDFINHIVEDDSGTLWFATNFAGLSAFRNGRFTNYLLDPQSPSSLANRVNRVFVENGRALWLATDRGVFRFRDGYVSPVNHEATATAFARDSTGSLWIGTTNGLMNVLVSGGTVALALVGDPHLEVTSLACTPDGILWIGTPHGLFYRLPEGSSRQRWQGERLVHRLRGEWVRCLMAERDNTLWIGTANRGVVRATPEGMLVTLNESNGLAGSTVSDILRDREGNVWIATSTGLSKLISEQMVSYTRAHGLPDHAVAAITRDSFGAMWFGTRNGVARLLDGRFTVYTRTQGLGDDYVLTLFADNDGSVWCGTEVGPTHVVFLGEHPRFIAYGASHGWVKGEGKINRVRAMYRDDEGNLWFGCDEGVSLLGNGKFQTHPVETSGERLVAGIVRDSPGDLWIGLHSGGILRYAVESARAGRLSLRLKERVGRAEGMKDDNIRCALRSGDGSLWFGTRFGGVSRIALREGTIASITNYTTGNGIASNWVNGIVEDRRGNIWVATSKGTSRLTFGEDSTNSPLVRTFTIEDGLAGDGISCVYEDVNSILWFGTYDGVTRYDPSGGMPATVPPPIYITNFIISGESDTAALAARHATLSYAHHSIAFEYIGLSFRGEGKMRYRYMLEGFDTSWSAFTDHRYAHYTHLPPGRYVFKVRAMNGDGVWSAGVASFPFTVAPPFWTTWWFILSVLTALGALIVIIHRARVRQAVALERLRLRIAADLHDDVGSTLSSIAISSELVRRELTETSSASRILSRISADARSIMELIDDAVWAINPGNDSLDDLLLRMKAFAAEVLEAKNIACVFTFPQQHPQAKIPMEKRRHLYLIFKEAINNIVKHAGCATIRISATLRPKSLSLAVEDDGRGFNCNAVSAGNGLDNMRRRAKLLGCTLDVRSEVGKGTSIQLDVPLT